MIDNQFSGEVERLIQARTVHDNDVAVLRQIVWQNSILTEKTIDLLFTLQHRCAIFSPVWNAFFIEAVEQFLLRQNPPLGFLDEGGAEWLRDRIAGDGSIRSATELDLLITILEHAQNAPDRLKSFALSEIEATVLTGKGPTRIGASVRPACVDENEVLLLRRLIFASAGQDATIVSSEEADLLFRLKDATIGGQNTDSWMMLFVQGVGNHLMAHSDYQPLSIDEARRLGAEIEYNTPSIFKFFTRTLPREWIGRGTIVEAFSSIFPPDRDPLAKTLAIERSRSLSVDEAGWLKQHIAADGHTDEFEKALMTFIVEESGTLPAGLDIHRQSA